MPGAGSVHGVEGATEAKPLGRRRQRQAATRLVSRCQRRRAAASQVRGRTLEGDDCGPWPHEECQDDDGRGRRGTGGKWPQ